MMIRYNRVAGTCTVSRDGFADVVLSLASPTLDADIAALGAEVAPAVRYIDAATLRERCEAAGIWNGVAALLVQSPALMLTVLTLREGVASNDPDARALITAAGGDPDAILA